MSESAIQRGLFRAQVLKKQYKEIEKNPASSQTGVFMKPDRNKVSNMKDANYDKLNEEGYVDVETPIKDGDVIIGMVTPRPVSRDGDRPFRDDEKPFKDGSILFKSLLPGTIDKVITGTNNDGYPIIKIRIRMERIPMIGDKFACYDDQTEILTTSGWIRFTNLSKDHSVATLTNSNTLTYERPLDIYSYDHTGPMYTVQQDDIDLCVTPNHKMWVSDPTSTDSTFKLEMASDINSQPRIYCKSAECINTQSDLRSFMLADYGEVCMDLWLTLLGNYISRGRLTAATSETKASTEIYIDSDALSIATLMRTCEQLGFEASVDGNSVSIFNQALYAYLSSLDTDIEGPQLPAWVWDLSLTQAQVLLEVILDHNPEPFTYSQAYADSIQRLCLHAGRSATVTARDDDTLTVSICADNQPIIDGGIWTDYRGKVYCCEVTSGVICVRRNGVIVFSGNSRHSQKGTCGIKLRTADMPFTVTGLSPDLILNPNAIPTRMTTGQLIESMFSKLCVIKGVFGDATPFMGVDLEKINRELVEAGWQDWGTETMYNGMTGRKLRRRIFIGPTYYQRLKQMVGDKAHCLSTDHEVLTLDGWKFNHQLSTSDKVATLVDGNLVYQRPTKVLDYPDYQGDMYHIATQQLDLMVTPNHRMFVSKSSNRENELLDYDFELAEDISGKCRRYKKDAAWDAKDYQFRLPAVFCDNGAIYPEKDVDMDSWLRFFGTWIDDDQSSYNDTFTADDQQLRSYMKQFGEASNKHLHEWVWHLSTRQARLLLESIVSCDVYYTSSTKLADNIMQLALHCGWSSNKQLQTETGNNMWRLEIIKSENNPVVNHGHTDQTETIIKNYNKPVFCLEVPGGVFYVRRNGKAVWTGNSRARGPTQLMTRAPPEGRSRDGGLRNGEMERDALLAHGMAAFQKERMVDNSDIYTAHVCDLCGLLAHKVPDTKYYICRSCQNSTKVSTIVIPYAFKLFMQELRSISILGRIRTAKSIVVPRR